MVRSAHGRPLFDLSGLIFDFISSVSQSQEEEARSKGF